MTKEEYWQPEESDGACQNCGQGQQVDLGLCGNCLEQYRQDMADMSSWAPTEEELEAMYADSVSDGGVF